MKSQWQTGLLLLASTMAPAVAALPQSASDDGLAGFTKSPTEHIINELEEPIVVRKVRGSIVDQGTFPLPNALFEVRGPGDGKAIKHARTDEHGRFTIRNVPPGTYRFKATMPGFQSVIGTLVVSKKADKTSEVRVKLPFGI